jgi:hypothetical protein
MGINRETAAFLCEARADGASFRRVLTLGRQNLNMDRAALGELASRRGIPEATADAVFEKYAEPFFREFLGSEVVDAIDNSQYEGAALVHDLNKPVPTELDQGYDAIIDGGTLEHVFNFPTAMVNCMRLLRTGGRLFIFTPANNQLGHGFYQFSPELFYRTLAPAHGFEVETMLAVQYRFASTECGSTGRTYRVADPAKVGSRITLVNSRPITLMIQARKIQHLDAPFDSFPQQSDYSEIWKTGDGDCAPPPRLAALSRLANPLRLLKRLLPAGLGLRLRNEYDQRFIHSFRNNSFYTPKQG